MKNLLAILILVFTFGFMGCDNGTNDNGSNGGGNGNGGDKYIKLKIYNDYNFFLQGQGDRYTSIMGFKLGSFDRINTDIRQGKSEEFTIQVFSQSLNNIKLTIYYSTPSSDPNPYNSWEYGKESTPFNFSVGETKTVHFVHNTGSGSSYDITDISLTITP